MSRVSLALSCWEPAPETSGIAATCVLADGHAGPHVYVPDEFIRVELADSGEEPERDPIPPSGGKAT